MTVGERSLEITWRTYQQKCISKVITEYWILGWGWSDPVMRHTPVQEIHSSLRPGALSSPVASQHGQGGNILHWKHCKARRQNAMFAKPFFREAEAPWRCTTPLSQLNIFKKSTTWKSTRNFLPGGRKTKGAVRNHSWSHSNRKVNSQQTTWKLKGLPRSCSTSSYSMTNRCQWWKTRDFTARLNTCSRSIVYHPGDTSVNQVSWEVKRGSSSELCYSYLDFRCLPYVIFTCREKFA